jgi:hypothetical protein
VFDLSGGDLGANDLENFDGVFWASDGSSASSTANFTSGAGNANFTAVLNAASNGATIFVSGFGAFNLANNPTFSSMIPWSGSNFLFTDGDGGPNTFFNGAQNTPNACSGWDTWHPAPTAPTGRFINFFSTAGVSTPCMMGWINTTSYWAGGWRSNAAIFGDSTAQCINYGDIEATQSSNSRENHLMNLLCQGEIASRWNPEYAPRVLVAQELFDPVNAWDGSAQVSMDDGSVSIGSPTWQNDGGGGWSSPPHYGYDYSYGPTYNNFYPWGDTWAIADIDSTQITGSSWGSDSGDTDGGRAFVYSNYMSTSDGFSVNHYHTGSGYWRTGGYNNMVLVAGPFDFSDTGYFTADPVMYARVYHRVFSSWWLSYLWGGWTTSSTPVGWTGDPLTPTGYGGSGLFAPAWDSATLVGTGQPVTGSGDGWGDALEGTLVEIPLTGAAGESSVYVCFNLHSSESLGDNFFQQETTIVDGFSIALGDSGTGPPLGL